jgi:hypothetical protein
MKKIATLFFISIIAFPAMALDANHFTITRISAPYFIVDGNSPATITSAYVGFEVKNNSNSAVTYSGLKFTITSIGTSVVGQNYSLVSPATGITNIGTLLPGQSKVCYYYVSYPANTTPQATFNVLLTDNTAGTKIQSFVIRNRSSISANAGGTATQTFSNQDIIGGLVTDDVTYVVGNVQNGDENDFQVAVSAQFDPTKITLLGTEVISSSIPGIAAGTTDSLYFLSGNGNNGATVTIRWTFRITGINFTTYLLPCAGATSGSTNYKYALNTSLGSGTPITISSSANPLTIAKSSDKTLYGIVATAVFTVTIQNPGAYGVSIDKITDELPTGFVYVALDASSQVTASNSTTVPQTGATGALTFEGGVASGANTSYFIPAGGSLVLKYTATTASVSLANLVTTARSFVGITETGAAQNTVSVSATLPLNFLSFTGEVQGSATRLSWKTANEVNSRLFEIEKSNGNNFYKIGELAAYNNGALINDYAYTDARPAGGISYYRLRAVDIDGKYQYSDIVSVTRPVGELFVRKLYPNPFTDKLSITIETSRKQEILLYLYDLSGKLIRQQTTIATGGIQEIILDKLDRLESGIYYLQSSVAGETNWIKLVKLQR